MSRYDVICYIEYIISDMQSIYYILYAVYTKAHFISRVFNRALRTNYIALSIGPFVGVVYYICHLPGLEPTAPPFAGAGMPREPQRGRADAKIAYFIRKTTYSNRKLPYILLINIFY